MEKPPLKIDSQIKKAIKDTAQTTAYPIAGFKGLELNVRVNVKGDKVADFRHRYTHLFTGKRPYMTLGQYPALTLEQARQAFNDNMILLAKGKDPIEHREQIKQAEINARKNTMQYFIREWKENLQAKNITRKSIENNNGLLLPIENELGKMLVTDIKPSMVINFIKNIQKTQPAKGIGVKKVLKSILQLAKAHQVIEHNPASDLVGTLIPHKTKHHPAITDPAEFAKLLNEIDSLPADNTHRKEILQLLALTFARIGDICSMKWADINLFTQQWEFRPQKAGKREDMSDLITPLPLHAVAIFERMQAITGGQEYVFYNGRRKKEKHAMPQAVRNLLNSPAMNDGKGYKGIHSPHGFRATAKTMLMERLGYDELITELQLGHRMLNSYGRAYSRMDMLTQRKAMMTDWANYLDDLRAGKIDNVIHFTKAQIGKAVNN